MQKINGGEIGSAGVSKGAALLFLTQITAGTWSCWINHNNINNSLGASFIINDY